MIVDTRGSKFEFSGFNDEILNKVLSSLLFKNWIDSLDKSLSIKSIKLQSYKMNDKDIIYIKLDTIFERFNRKIPRIIVLEGNSVEVLTKIICTETRIIYTILVRKIVITSGGFQYILPFEKTHTIVPDQNYVAEFFKRITGFDEDSSSFINLIESTEECQYNALNAFCGPSDSRVYPFLLEKEMHEKDIKSLDGKEIGPDTHLHIVPFDEYPQYVYDGVSTAPLAVIDHSKKD